MWTCEHLGNFQGALFKKVIAMVEDYIERGVLIVGERLPSERELATKLKINRSTVVHALTDLTERGILIRKLGSGTYVNPQKWGQQSYPTIHWHLPSHFHSKPSFYEQKVKQLKMQNHSVCDLANGDLPIALIPELTLPKMSSQELIYHEKNSEILQLGLPSLRQKIAQYMYEQFSMKVSDDEILITSGTQQSLFLITQGLLKPGDAVGIESPSYFYSLPLFQAAGLRLYPIRTDSEGICLDELAQITKQYHLKWVFLNPIFQNPTGLVMNHQRKKALLDFCHQNYIGIVEDDAYSALYFEDVIDCSPIKKLDRHNQVIYLGSLSKYIGRSIRVGWMVAPSSIVQKLSDIRHYIDSGLSILPQLLAEDYLCHHYQTHQPKLRARLKEKRDQLIAWLMKHHDDEISYLVPKGGFHLYATLAYPQSQQQEDFLNRWLTKGIIVARGENFGDNQSTIRLSYGHLYPHL